MRIRKSVIFTAIFLFCAVLLVGCKKNPSVKFAQKSLTINLGHETTLDVSVDNGSADDLVFTTSVSDIISYVNGKVKPLKAGTTTLKAALSNKTSVFDECVITVTDEEYTITYELDGGVNHSNNPQKFKVSGLPLALKDATKPGYAFSGWYLSADFSGAKVTFLENHATNVKVYAKWVEATKIINYHLYDGVNHNDNPADFSNADLPITLKNPTREHYDFAGWYSNADFTGNPVTQILSGQTAEVNLHAKWTPIIYTVTYELNDGVNHVNNLSSYTVANAPITLQNPTREGYRFNGWFLNADFSGEKIQTLSEDNLSNLTLHAKWQVASATHNLNFSLDGGVFSSLKLTYEVGVAKNLGSPTKEAHKFLGWYLNSEFASDAVTAIPEEGFDDNQVLYAKWEYTGIYTITYELNGGFFGPYATYEDLYIDFLTDLYNFLGISEPLSTFIHGDGKTTGFDGTHQDGTQLLSSFKIYLNRDSTDSSYFIASQQYRDKWLEWFDLMEKYVTTVNSTQSFWGSTYVGYVRLRDFARNRFAISHGVSSANYMPGQGIKSYKTNDEPVQLYDPNGSKNFVGWYDNPSFGGIVYRVIPTGSFGNKKFYAKWEETEDYDAYVNASWTGKNNGDSISFEGKTLIFGQNAFLTIQSAVDAVSDNTVIYVAEGTYSAATIINKNNITLVGPNAEIDPVMDTRITEAVITAKISVAKNVIGLTINGFAFNGAGQVVGHGDGGIDKFVFKYNNCSGTSTVASAEGILDFVCMTDTAKNTNFHVLNNKFSYGSQLRHVRLGNIENLYVNGNLFDATARSYTDALRLVGTENKATGGCGVAGEVFIRNNRFQNIGQRAIWFSRYSANRVEIEQNYFDNIGGADAGEPINITNWTGKANEICVINVRYNTFKNVSASGAFQTIRIHNQEATKANWTANVNYNKFIDIAATLPSTFTLISNGGTAINSIALINANNNYFDGNAPSSISAYFVGVKEISAHFDSESDLPELDYSQSLKPDSLEITNEISEMALYTDHALIVNVLPAEAIDKRVRYSSSDLETLTVSENGVISALKVGTATITVYLAFDRNIKQELEIEVSIPDYISAYYTNDSVLKIGDQEKITLVRNGLPGTISFVSSDEAVLTVAADGSVTAIGEGEAKVFINVEGVLANWLGFTVVGDFSQEDELLELLVNNHFANIIQKKEITVTGYQFVWYHDLLGSVNRYLFEDLDVIEKIVPETNSNRPGGNFEKKYITIHDTGSSAQSASASQHAQYVYNNSDGSTSWHYSIGNDGIYHQIPDNERAYHAGDGSNRYQMTDTGIAVTTENPVLTILANGKYAINGIETSIVAPTKDGVILTTADIVEHGIRIEIRDGKYWLGTSWYSSSFGKIGNGGGNYDSIGIETMVNLGSDLYWTWQKTAKTVAKLLEDNNLTYKEVVQHNYFSGKNCPQTMRGAGFWEDFIENVKMEHSIRMNYSDYTITIKADDSGAILENGRTFNKGVSSVSASYTITVTKGDYTKSVTLYSAVPGKLA